jgi:hypothetical protein
MIIILGIIVVASFALGMLIGYKLGYDYGRYDRHR